MKIFEFLPAEGAFFLWNKKLRKPRLFCNIIFNRNPSSLQSLTYARESPRIQSQIHVILSLPFADNGIPAAFGVWLKKGEWFTSFGGRSINRVVLIHPVSSKQAGTFCPLPPKKVFFSFFFFGQIKSLTKGSNEKEEVQRFRFGKWTASIWTISRIQVNLRQLVVFSVSLYISSYGLAFNRKGKRRW